MTFVDHAPDRGQGRYGALALFAALTLGVGVLGAFATEPEITGWYASLAKPSFNPPSWVFAPVWTLLYLMMAVAAWRVWRVAGLRPMLLFFAQLALNCAWSFLFFHFHRIGAALGDIVALLALILATALSFTRRDRIAGLLLLPYGLWVAFATLLNAAIWKLN